ncbi:DUF2442 domain-containing protein [Clostridium perfringens]|nr:DUF2442 domain-containing protein [Clostridium perfringens]
MINNISIYKDYVLKIELNNGDIKYFNVEPYIALGDFKVLKDKEIFKNFYLDELEGINWLNGALCLSKDTLLKNSYYDD